jgi:hypothetical protein
VFGGGREERGQHPVGVHRRGEQGEEFEVGAKERQPPSETQQVRGAHVGQGAAAGLPALDRGQGHAGILGEADLGARDAFAQAGGRG